MATITIIKSWPRTGRLKLSPTSCTDANRTEVIIWKLRSGCGVKSITDISPKSSPSSDIIWKEAPHPVPGTGKWRAVIDEDSDDDAEYNYTISWTTDGIDPDPAHPTKYYDPKIAVKPDKFSFSMLTIALASILTAMFSVMLFSKRRDSK